MKKHKGILVSINEANDIKPYTKLTVNDITKALTDLTINSKDSGREFVMYTDLRGYRVFDFTIKFGESFFGNWWITHGKHLDKNVLYLSVVRKACDYKVKVSNYNGEYRFNLYEGTKVIGYFNNIKALNRELIDLNKMLDGYDAYQEFKRKERINKRELEGKVQLIENKYRNLL